MFVSRPLMMRPRERNEIETKLQYYGRSKEIQFNKDETSRGQRSLKAQLHRLWSETCSRRVADACSDLEHRIVHDDFEDRTRNDAECNEDCNNVDRKLLIQRWD